MKNGRNKSSKSRYLKIEVGCNITHHNIILRIWLLHSPLLPQNRSLLNIIDILYFIYILHVRIHIFPIQISCKSKVHVSGFLHFRICQKIKTFLYDVYIVNSIVLILIERQNQKLNEIFMTFEKHYVDIATALDDIRCENSSFPRLKVYWHSLDFTVW